MKKIRVKLSNSVVVLTTNTVISCSTYGETDHIIRLVDLETQIEFHITPESKEDMDSDFKKICSIMNKEFFKKPEIQEGK